MEKIILNLVESVVQGGLVGAVIIVFASIIGAIVCAVTGNLELFHIMMEAFVISTLVSGALGVALLAVVFFEVVEGVR